MSSSLVHKDSEMCPPSGQAQQMQRSTRHKQVPSQEGTYTFLPGGSRQGWAAVDYAGTEANPNLLLSYRFVVTILQISQCPHGQVSP